jgi:hypothetical protein
MDINIFEAFLNERIAKEKKIFEEEEIKRKSTIIYSYEQIMKQIDLEITESVGLFNSILNEKCNDLKILLYHSGSLFRDKSPESIRELTLLFDSTGKSDSFLSKDLKSFDYFKLEIALKYNRDTSSNGYYFSAEYQFSTSRDSYERNEFKTIVDDIDQNKIINDLREFFDEFIKLYLIKSSILGYRTNK